MLKGSRKTGGIMISQRVSNFLATSGVSANMLLALPNRQVRRNFPTVVPTSVLNKWLSLEVLSEQAPATSPTVRDEFSCNRRVVFSILKSECLGSITILPLIWPRDYRMFVYERVVSTNCRKKADGLA